MISDKVLNEAKKLIGDFVTDRRDELGLTQQQLADKAGLGLATIQRVEGAKFIPDGKSLLKLCYALDCYFFFGQKEANEPLIQEFRDRWRRPGDEK